MLKIIFLFVFLTLNMVCCGGSLTRSEKDDESADYFKMMVNGYPRTKTYKSYGSGYLKEYQFGKRQHGDKVLTMKVEKQTFSAPPELDFRFFRHDSNGLVQNHVTYVFIKARHDHRDGKAYIIDGGIGQPYIEMAVESYNSSNIDVYGAIYGK